MRVLLIILGLWFSRQVVAATVEVEIPADVQGSVPGEKPPVASPSSKTEEVTVPTSQETAHTSDVTSTTITSPTWPRSSSSVLYPKPGGKLPSYRLREKPKRSPPYRPVTVKPRGKRPVRNISHHRFSRFQPRSLGKVGKPPPASRVVVAAAASLPASALKDITSAAAAARQAARDSREARREVGVLSKRITTLEGQVRAQNRDDSALAGQIKKLSDGQEVIKEEIKQAPHRLVQALWIPLLVLLIIATSVFAMLNEYRIGKRLERYGLRSFAHGGKGWWHPSTWLESLRGFSFRRRRH